MNENTNAIEAGTAVDTIKTPETIQEDAPIVSQSEKFVDEEFLKTVLPKLIGTKLTIGDAQFEIVYYNLGQGRFSAQVTNLKKKQVQDIITKINEDNNS